MHTWTDAHFAADEFSDYSSEYVTSGADREWFSKDYDVFDGAFGGEMNGVDFVGIDFAGEMNGVPTVGVDFGVDPLTVGVLGVGLLAGAASMGHHVLSIHHLLHGHRKQHKTPAHAAAAAVSEHDAEVNAMSGPSAGDPYQLGG